MTIFLFIIYISLYLIDNYNPFLLQFQASILPEIISFENNQNLTQEIFKEFRRINSENKLLEENIKFKKSYYPDISVIITVYNQAHCIHKGLRSVQNQSLKNIEIILIDDCSEDNSIEVIKQYQKEDPRIVLISHDTNEGEMKSRVDGIRKARGKYFTIIDGDDALIHKDILNNSLYIITKAKLEVVQFGGLLYSGGKVRQIINNYNNNRKIIYQPQLRTIFYQKIQNEDNYLLGNRVIWGKLIKKELFKRMVSYLGTEFTDDYNNDAEDTLLALAIFHLAKSYYVMKETGYYYSKDDKKPTFNKLSNKKCKINNKIKNFGWYMLYKFLVEESKNDMERKEIINEMKMPDIRKIIKQKLDDRHYKILYSIYDKMLEWNCWDDKQRKYIIEQKRKVIKI